MEQKKITLSLTEQEVILLRDAIVDKKCNLSSNENGVVQRDISKFSDARKQAIHSCVDIKTALDSIILKQFR